MMADQGGGGAIGYGQMEPQDSGSDFNTMMFVVRQMTAQMDTVKLVKVIAVHAGSGTPPAAGTVDVLPLVNQIDGNGNATEHGTVFGIPFFRLQGGTAAVILDPKVDDIGYVVVSDRDISNVKSTKKQANPGSFRKYDVADGIYVGSVLMAAPTQYVQFTDDGIKIADKSGNVIEMKSDGIHVTGKLFVGEIVATGEITANDGANKVTLTQHVHSANNTPPTPGH